MRNKFKNPFTERLGKAVPFVSRRSSFFRYGLVFVVCLASVFLFLGTKAVLGTLSPFLFLLGAVLITAWYGGLRAGIATLIFGIFFSLEVNIVPAMTRIDGSALRNFFQFLLFIFESVLVLFLIYRRNKSYESMQDQAAKQSLIATVGAFSLEEDNISLVMDRIVKSITKALNVDSVALFELSPDEKFLRVRSGMGWKRGVVGGKLIDLKAESQASYTLGVYKPVIVNNLSEEKRFGSDELLTSHALVSSLSVVVPGNPRPYGVLSIHTNSRREFTKDDVNFLLSLSNVLAATIDRNDTQEEAGVMADVNSKLISLDPQKTLSEVISALVPGFADVCEIYLNGGSDRANLIEIKSISKEKERLFREMNEKYPLNNTSKRLTAKVLHTGKASYYSVIPESFVKDSSIDEEQEQIFEKINFLSKIVIPVKIRNKTIGTITFGSFSNGRLYTKRNFIFAQQIAGRIAVAIDNATLYQEARSAIQARDEFLSIASHELKTPLTSMLLQLQTVLRSIKSQSLANFSIEKTMVSLESTIAQSKRLSRLVNDLLNISLITTGRLELEREKIDLSKIVSDVTTRLEDQAMKSGSSVVFINKPKVIGNWDPIRIEQVVTNLVTNAIKYGNGKPITIDLTTDKKYAVLNVLDHGIGIPKDQQEKIFDRFHRGAVNSSIKGLGVGLYLISEIVKAHHGKISVKSTPKEGSVFTLQLPL